MELNKEQIRSITESSKEKFGSELNDEILEAISGGRNIRPIEHLIIGKYENAALSMSDNEFYDYVDALSRYMDYINSLPDDSDTKLFVLEEWK